MSDRAAPGKSADAYRTIGEVAEELKLPQHVLRFWETRFPQVKPLKRAGGRRFYRPDDVALLQAIKAMLYGQGYTIKGVQRLLQDQGARSVAASLSIDAVAPDRRRHAGDDPGLQGREPDGPAPSGRSDPATAGLVSPAGLLARLDALARDLADCAHTLVAARTIDDRL